MTAFERPFYPDVPSVTLPGHPARCVNMAQSFITLTEELRYKGAFRWILKLYKFY